MHGKSGNRYHHHHHQHRRRRSASGNLLGSAAAALESNTPPLFRQLRTSAVAARTSKTGTVYTSDDHGDGAPVVELYTKEGCTLCDDAAEVLRAARGNRPHTLKLVDITDDCNAAWFTRYQYDIPVLHVAGQYWTKHRISAAEAEAGLAEASTGEFGFRSGQPTPIDPSSRC